MDGLAISTRMPVISATFSGGMLTSTLVRVSRGSVPGSAFFEDHCKAVNLDSHDDKEDSQGDVGDDGDEGEVAYRDEYRKDGT